MAPLEWWAKHDDVLAVARWLVNEEDYEANSLLGYFEAPWKWEKERTHMLEHERLEKEIRLAAKPYAGIEATRRKARETCKTCNTPPDEDDSE